MDTEIVVGVGHENGLGAALCRRFAPIGKHVFVVGRTQSKLDTVVSTIKDNGGTATAFVADCTEESQIKSLFEVASNIGSIEIAIYNAGNIFPGRFIEMESNYFTDAWKVCCFGGFLFGREAMQYMLPNNKGSLLFTGASAGLRGRAGFGAFNSSKAALRTLAQAMAKEVGPEGIHVAHVIVDGGINGEKLQTGALEYAEKMGEEGLINIESIVDAYEFLYKQPKTGWTFEVDIRTAIENW